MRDLLIDSPLLKKYGLTYINEQITHYMGSAERISREHRAIGQDPDEVLENLLEQLTNVLGGLK